MLSLVRLPLAGALWVYPGDITWVLVLVVLAAASDMLDGTVARALRRRLPPAQRAADQAVGAWLDPLCDKAFTLSMVLVVAVGFDVSVAVIVLVLAREILIAPLIVLYHLLRDVRRTLRFDFSADRLGKLTTVLQFATAAAVVVLRPAVLPLATLAAVVGAVAAVHYVRRGIIAARIAARNPIAEQLARR